MSVENEASAEDAAEVVKILSDYNARCVEPHDQQPLTILLRDDAGKVMGGLRGNTNWDWLYVSILAVAESARGQGWGSRILAEAEREAVRRGCHSVYLDTFDFQALPFYERQGYTVFGTLDGFRGNHRRFFLQKRLIGAIASNGDTQSRPHP